MYIMLNVHMNLYQLSNAGWALGLSMYIFSWIFNLCSMIRLKQVRDIVGRGSYEHLA
jgi:hypothetical protein